MIQPNSFIKVVEELGTLKWNVVCISTGLQNGWFTWWFCDLYVTKEFCWYLWCKLDFFNHLTTKRVIWRCRINWGWIFFRGCHTFATMIYCVDLRGKGSVYRKIFWARLWSPISISWPLGQEIEKLEIGLAQKIFWYTDPKPLRSSIHIGTNKW